METRVITTSRPDSGRIRVGVVGSERHDVNEGSAVTRCGACAERLAYCGENVTSVQADLLLLIACKLDVAI